MRTFTPAQQAAIAGGVARWAHLARLTFRNATLYLNDQDLGFSIFWDDTGGGEENEFIGVGGLAAASGVEESTELKEHSIVLELSGIRDEDIALVLTEQVQGQRVMIWRALFDADHRVIGPPFVRFVGRMDTLSLVRDDSGRQIGQLRVTNRLADWTRAAPVRFNDQNHQSRHPGDRFFELAEETAETEVIWGRG
ncbi:hypothetical protein KAJ83_09780 [Marivibrio halodurans]|uniref:DUF2163 domain-containing protein n=1 Tax=Marivibrio halodurans TaxID=2039722 RepID=A0A8J7SMB4_9PROT|nr:hypothetical protein [Marivibrio halodurans]MBP5857298.1 hypothetical protein [Marivibrio halodurans]